MLFTVDNIIQKGFHCGHTQDYCTHKSTIFSRFLLYLCMFQSCTSIKWSAFHVSKTLRKHWINVVQCVYNREFTMLILPWLVSMRTHRRKEKRSLCFSKRERQTLLYRLNVK